MSLQNGKSHFFAQDFDIVCLQVGTWGGYHTAEVRALLLLLYCGVRESVTRNSGAQGPNEGQGLCGGYLCFGPPKNLSIFF